MASAKDLRKRIASVKNTQQITKAMKMVSAAKLRRAQEAIVSLRPYAQQMMGIVSGIARSGETDHPLLDAKRAEEGDKILVLLVSSDRGLCGGFNANVIKTAQRYIRTNAHKYKKFEIGFVGRKGYEAFKARGNAEGRYYQNFFTGLKFSKSQVLAEELISQYMDGEFDQVKFIYNEFKSAISQRPVVENFLPVRIDTQGAEEAIIDQNPVIYEPGRKEILAQLLPKHFATQVHRILLESLAAEHGARMTAMENATSNASDMLYGLTLEYNKSRQASITKELLEIISGSEAQSA